MHTNKYTYICAHIHTYMAQVARASEHAIDDEGLVLEYEVYKHLTFVQTNELPTKYSISNRI